MFCCESDSPSGASNGAEISATPKGLPRLSEGVLNSVFEVGIQMDELNRKDKLLVLQLALKVCTRAQVTPAPCTPHVHNVSVALQHSAVLTHGWRNASFCKGRDQSIVWAHSTHVGWYLRNNHT